MSTLISNVNDKYVLVAGPTASGKSRIALQLAMETGGIIVNADALQVYDCWSILTARPGQKETREVDHRLYGHVDFHTRYSVGDWIRDITCVKAESVCRTMIVVGGTGLYLSSLTKGLAPIPPISREWELSSADLIANEGVDKLSADLQNDDPETWSQIDQKNPARIRRAWEVLRSTGRGMVSWQRENEPPTVQLSQATAVVLNMDRDRLARRIKDRLIYMIENGALDECEAMLDRFDPALPSCRALGASQFIAHVKGRMGLDEAIEQAATVTRRYAKRQRTWFRSNMAHWQWIDLD